MSRTVNEALSPQVTAVTEAAICRFFTISAAAPIKCPRDLARLMLLQRKLQPAPRNIMPIRLRILTLFLQLPFAGCGGIPGMSWMNGGAPQMSGTGEALSCHGALADSDSYAEPQPGWEGRLIGYYRPKPTP
jgi:hypothetical protein